MENILTVLNAVKNYNEINELKKEVKASNEKSKENMKACKEFASQELKKLHVQIIKKDEKIRKLNVQLEEQGDIIKTLREENEKKQKILDHIPKFILFFCRKGV